MCEYCNTDELGDNYGPAIFEGKADIFRTSADYQLKIFGNALEMYFGIGGAEMLNEVGEINFCPFCGRRLWEDADGDIDDHDVSGLLE